MTDDKRKKIELCFDSVEKIVRLKSSLNKALSNVSDNLENTMDILEDRQFWINGDPFADYGLREGIIKLNNKDIDYIRKQYSNALWDTMDILLPHYRTTKEK